MMEEERPARRVRITPRTEDDFAGMLSISRMFPRNPAIQQVGRLEAFVAKAASDLMAKFDLLIDNVSEDEARIILNNSLRTRLYKELYAIDLATGIRSEEKAARSANAVIPPIGRLSRPDTPGGLSALWYRQLIHAVILAIHLYRVVSTASRINTLPRAQRNQLLEFYNNTILAIPPTKYEDSGYATKARKWGVKMLNHDLEAGALPFVDTRTIRAYARFRDMGAFLPGAMQLAFDGRFQVVSHEIAVAFPGSELIDTIFSTRQRPWYRDAIVNEYPVLEYYQYLRLALSSDVRTDLIHLCVHAQRGVQPTEMHFQEALVEIIGHGELLHIDEDQERYGGGEDPTDTFSMGPIQTPSSYDSITFRMSNLLFSDNRTVETWLGKIAPYLWVNPDPSDPEPAHTLQLAKVYRRTDGQEGPEASMLTLSGHISRAMLLSMHPNLRFTPPNQSIESKGFYGTMYHRAWTLVKVMRADKLYRQPYVQH